MKPDFKNKKVVVLGAGLSGLAAARLLVSAGAAVTIQDQGAGSLSGLEQMQNEGCRVQVGGQIKHDEAFDLCVISPGIDPRKEWVKAHEVRGTDIWSELELAWQFCQCPVVAVTGTNGKTTTTELIHSAFLKSGKRTLASGNIGLPFSEAVRQSDRLEVMILEVSSFQLEKIRDFRPHTSVFLNLTPDHLDRYDSMAAYAQAKNRIFENQQPLDFAVLNADMANPFIKAKRITFSTTNAGADYLYHQGMISHGGQEVLRMDQSHLRGIHNAENMMATLAVADAWALPRSCVVSAICNYKALPHRCEFVGCIDGVSYWNDSKATNIDALEKALLSQDRKVILIAGGKDKGFSFDSLASVVEKKVRQAILIGQTQDKIAASWKASTDITLAGDLMTAVQMAAKAARDGEIVLFSPACSSYDQFKSFEDRGDQFKSFVHAISVAKTTTTTDKCNNAKIQEKKNI